MVRSILRELLARRSDVLLLACRQRAKFEGWLKFELAAMLSQQPGVQDVKLEDCYPTGLRSDLSFRLGDNTWFVEMKTPNVNWRAAGVENRSRPITKNISSLIMDVQKLWMVCAPHKGLAIFCLFPIPARILDTEREKLDYHLGRVETACGLAPNSLMDGADFVQITDAVFVGTIVVEVEG